MMLNKRNFLQALVVAPLSLMGLNLKTKEILPKYFVDEKGAWGLYAQWAHSGNKKIVKIYRGISFEQKVPPEQAVWYRNQQDEMEYWHGKIVVTPQRVYHDDVLHSFDGLLFHDTDCVISKGCNTIITKHDTRDKSLKAFVFNNDQNNQNTL